MSAGALLAALAGALAVAGLWEALAAVERTAIAAAAGRLAAPLIAAGREGREATEAERRRLALVTTAVLGAAGALLAGPLTGAAAAVAGPASAGALLRSRRRRWRRRLASQAPEVARALGDALVAGRSVRAALEEVAGTASGPARAELGRAAARLRLGVPTDRVLEDLRARAGSPPWDTLCAAILLQRETGGDLAGLLHDLAGAFEAARRLEREAEGATAQSRFSAGLVLAMPLGAALLAELAGPGFAAGLLATPLGAALVCGAIALQAVAFVLIRRLARVT